MKILLIKQTSLGDVLHMTPVIRALKKWKPEAEIDIVTDKRALGILKNNPYINKLYVLDIYKYEKEIFKSPLKFFSTIKEFFSHIKEVRKKKYDIAIDLQGLERSIIFLYLCKAKKKYAKGKWAFVKSNYYVDINAIVGLISFLKFFGCPNDGVDLDYFLPETIEEDFNKTIERIKQTKNFEIEKDYIVFSPFSRWETKDLSVNKAREIIAEIKNLKDIGNVYTGITPPTSDKENFGNEHLFVTSADIKENKYIFNSIRKLSNKGFEKTKKFKKGDILYVCIGSIGKIALAKTDFSCNQQINVLRVNKEIDNEFVYYQLMNSLPLYI